MLGYFENGNPYIDVEIYGLHQLKKEKSTIKALVDTGFNGHIQIPFETAFPLGLTLVGIQQINTADGSSANQFVCLGTVRIDNKEVLVPINIGAGCPTLVGTQLFKAAAKNIKVDFVSEKIEISDRKENNGKSISS